MSAPESLPDLLDMIRRSGLVEPPRLAAAAGVADGPADLLARLLADGLLTPFQADNLAVGRWQGFTIGLYRVLDRIAAGGMSQVFLAEHRTTRWPVAVKVLAPRLAASEVARERFAREARAAAALSHPNIVRVVDVDATGETPYLVMEYIDGVSLQAAVARRGTFDAGTAAFCGRQVALGLQRAHEVGLVHRDIKPANVLVDRTGLAKILDLGIVRIPAESDLTRRFGERTILGTADYLAPEQAVNSSDVDTRADLYALGGTIYFLLAGHPPFPDCRTLDKVVQKYSADPPPVRHLRPDIPAGLSEVISRLLAREPADRYATPLDAAVALAPFARPAARFPGCLFDAPRPTLIDEAGTPTDAPPTGGTDPELEALSEPATDVVPVGRVSGAYEGPPTTRVSVAQGLGIWTAVGAVVTAALAMALIVLNR